MGDFRWFTCERRKVAVRLVGPHSKERKVGLGSFEGTNCTAWPAKFFACGSNANSKHCTDSWQRRVFRAIHTKPLCAPGFVRRVRAGEPTFAQGFDCTRTLV